jgi:hypothetical protein
VKPGGSVILSERFKQQSRNQQDFICIASIKMLVIALIRGHDHLLTAAPISSIFQLHNLL